MNAPLPQMGFIRIRPVQMHSCFVFLGFFFFFSGPVVSPRNRASVSGRRPGAFYALPRQLAFVEARKKILWKHVKSFFTGEEGEIAREGETCAYTFRKFNERSKRRLRAKAARSVLRHNVVR